MNGFMLRNKATAKLAVWLEPWAAIYYLRQAEEITFEHPLPLERPGYYVTVIWEAETIQVFAEGGFDTYPLVCINGQEVDPFNDFDVTPA
jgi:hypothetical protein